MKSFRGSKGFTQSSQKKSKTEKCSRGVGSLKANKENEIPMGTSIDKFSPECLLSAKLRKKEKTKYETAQGMNKCSSRQIITSKLINNKSTADKCIMQIEQELNQLRELACKSNGQCFVLQPIRYSENTKSIQRDQGTQTIDRNVEYKKKIVMMKTAVLKMKERMEELEVLYRTDNKNMLKLEKELKIKHEKLSKAQSEIEKYKVKANITISSNLSLRKT